MLLWLMVLITSTFAQETPGIFTIHRVEINNRAIIATPEADLVKVGDEFTVETPYGDCHLPVTEVITDYFYVDTQQCQSEFVQKGTKITSTTKVIVEPAEPTESEIAAVENTSETSTSDGFMQSELYQKYIKAKASAYVSYYTGNALDGKISYSNTNAIEDFKGSNAVGFGAEYKIANLPYSLSVHGGAAYMLPRSFGRYRSVTPAGVQKTEFSNNPQLQMLSFYGNLRYEFNERTYATLGLNRLLTHMSDIPGEMSGDFGLHLGARYYPMVQLKQMFVDANINFYNMDYEYQNVKADFNLTELEVKAGYTF